MSRRLFVRPFRTRWFFNSPIYSPKELTTYKPHHLAHNYRLQVQVLLRTLNSSIKHSVSVNLIIFQRTIGLSRPFFYLTHWLSVFEKKNLFLRYWKLKKTTATKNKYYFTAISKKINISSGLWSIKKKVISFFIFLSFLHFFFFCSGILHLWMNE